MRHEAQSWIMMMWFSDIFSWIGTLDCEMHMDLTWPFCLPVFLIRTFIILPMCSSLFFLCCFYWCRRVLSWPLHLHVRSPVCVWIVDLLRCLLAAVARFSRLTSLDADSCQILSTERAPTLIKPSPSQKKKREVLIWAVMIMVTYHSVIVWDGTCSMAG